MRSASWAFLLLFLAGLGQAAPIVAAIINALVQIGTRAGLASVANAGRALASGPVGRMFGMSWSRGKWDDLVIVNGLLYYGSDVALGATLKGGVIFGGLGEFRPSSESRFL